MSAPGLEPGTVYFCVDIETSGPVPYLYNMISLGAVAVRTAEGRLQPGASFYVEIVPEFEGFDPETIPIHKLTPEHLREHGVPSAEAMQRLEDWVRGQLAPGERAVFVGHNAAFDWSFVSFYFAWLRRKNPFGYKALDTKALAMGKLGVSWWNSNKEVLAEHYPELRPPARELVHRADHDARFQADILCALLNPR